ncbi:MAG: hypothetical protein DRO40_04375 [Thermoprotei archaeon]|nr:MAG: hypothetical protein DRO40_04375 [Thermoprotei archaeon]
MVIPDSYMNSSRYDTNSGNRVGDIKDGSTLKVITYTYYNSPWSLGSGDDVRVHKILSSLAKTITKVITFNLSALVADCYTVVIDNVVYISMPRKFYRFISKIVRWRRHYDLNPLTKLTHYIDELIVAIKLHRDLGKANMIMVFGSMSLFSFMLRLLKVKRTIVYDPLANYAQTLYLRSRKSLLEFLKYGLYLALHKLQIRSSDVVIYPSRTDLDNAVSMFKPARSSIIPNPLPICFDSLEEYTSLRNRRKDFNRTYFVLLAGGRGKGNEEAVRLTMELFNEFPPEKFRLIITGPWLDVKKLVRNPSIELVGMVSKEKLKEILAMCDYGLSPIFSHAAGTFLKVLAYVASGLNIIASPQSLQGINLSTLRDRIVLIARNFNEYKSAVKKALLLGPRSMANNIITCRERDKLLRHYIEEFIDYLKTHHQIP